MGTNKRKRYMVDGRPFYSINSIATTYGVGYAVVAGRVAEHGPDNLTAEILQTRKPRPKGLKTIYVEYPPHGQVSFSKIALTIHPKMKHTNKWFQSRWRAFGSPPVIESRFFTMTNEEVFDETGETGWSSRPGAGEKNGKKVADQKYLDPTIMKDIPFADLENLSNRQKPDALVREKLRIGSWERENLLKHGDRI